ncbi:DNA-binding protein [Actinomycetota bacterium]
MAAANAVNAAQQSELYGAPLGELCQGVIAALGLTQSRLADVLGLSAPMLSQLMSAQRVKIGNPAVLHRLQELLALADEAPRLDVPQITARLEAVRGAAPTLSGSRSTTGATAVVGALRSIAGAAELRAAAAAVPGTALAAALLEAAGE